MMWMEHSADAEVFGRCRKLHFLPKRENRAFLSDKRVTCSSEIPSLHLHKWPYSFFFFGQGNREQTVLNVSELKTARRRTSSSGRHETGIS